MGRFESDGEDGISYELWETILSNALGGRKGQAALAEMESALLALPKKQLVHGTLATNQGDVCAIGALVAHHKSVEQGVDIETIIEALGAGVRCWCGHVHGDEPCTQVMPNYVWDAKTRERTQQGDRVCRCECFEVEGEDAWERTIPAGQWIGLNWTVAYHLAWLNDQEFGNSTPPERYAQMLAWVRRAQGKESLVPA